MKITRLFSYIFFSILLTSCEFKCQLGNSDNKAEQKDSTANGQPGSSVNKVQTLNDIELQAKDVQVYRAFLATESGDLVPAGNTVALGEKISLVLNIESGWKEEDGKSFIGASEKITTSNGEELLNTGDLFAAYDESGLSASDAKVVTLKARITSPAAGADYYIVDFRVWDKKGTGEITGKYKFYIR